MELKRVVVTGIGALTPLGNTVEETWNGMVNGVSSADDITHFDASEFKTKFACEVKGFNALDYFDRKEARKYDPYAQYGLVAAEQAVVDSGVDLDKINKNRVGVIWASGIGGITTFQEEVRGWALGSGVPRFNPFFIPKMIADIAAGHISIKFGFRGPNYATVSACASSANSLADAFNYIRLGKADMFVTGGSEASIIEGGVGGFNAMHAISTRNDDPKTGSRPFDKDRDGFVLGEGGCAIFFEEYEHAIKRGAKIYAEVAGAGLSADAYHMTSPHPEGLGASLSMQAALEDAEMNPEDIDHINTHGTSTPLGDISEPLAIKTAFGDHAYKININSTKSMTGHLLG
ncbi:MAG: beta-ketoacyl-ACP synthase II, partial [Bacteroidales bacterium]|nr:beta-ketoacyl-ACP synthase II [Bacteroidales bacterium]